VHEEVACAAKRKGETVMLSAAIVFEIGFEAPGQDACGAFISVGRNWKAEEL